MIGKASRRALPAPLDIPWRCKPVDSARTRISVLDDGRLHLEIWHELIRGVTPDMLLWWFRHLEGDMAYAGGVYPRYRVWHPRDHVAVSYGKASAGAPVGPGVELHIREAFGRRPEFFIDARSIIEKLDIEGFEHHPRWHGLPIAAMHYRFQRAQAGTYYVNSLTMGFAGRRARVLNWLIRTFVFGEARAQAWIRHNIEEVGNFESFLPALFEAQQR